MLRGMKHKRNQISAAIALLFTLAGSMVWHGNAHAQTARGGSITQELHVSARIPAHRDIILDVSGRIIQISSNTSEDVTPQVYLLEGTPKNRRPLTAELYKEYRRSVPEGTAKYGVLYVAQHEAAAGILFRAQRP
jgi:hypothetical protein